MGECRKRGTTSIGYIDPNIIFKNHQTYPRFWTDTEKNIKMFLENQRYKKYILFPYNYGDHWILFDLCLETGTMLVYDSLKKPKKEYQEMIDALQG